jgi:amino acid transporter
MYIGLSGSHANALTFGQSVLQAATPEGTPIDQRLQRLFAILLVAVICQLQAFSRINYVRFSNVFAIYKITFLSIITVCGYCALGNRRADAATVINTPYGIDNLEDGFEGTTSQPYPIALALLIVMRAYHGYENANFVGFPNLFLL